jgi:hypothetical protein
MHYVSQIASTPRVLHSTSIDTTALQNLDGSDISMDDSELPNSSATPALALASARMQPELPA